MADWANKEVHDRLMERRELERLRRMTTHPPLDLEALAALEAAATPAPWLVKEHGTPHKGSIDVEENGRAVETVATAYCGPTRHGLGNARLIAAARNALPTLLALAREAQTLREQNARLRERCATYALELAGMGALNDR